MYKMPCHGNNDLPNPPNGGITDDQRSNFIAFAQQLAQEANKLDQYILTKFGNDSKGLPYFLLDNVPEDKIQDVNIPTLGTSLNPVTLAAFGVAIDKTGGKSFNVPGILDTLRLRANRSNADAESKAETRHKAFKALFGGKTINQLVDTFSSTGETPATLGSKKIYKLLWQPQTSSGVGENSNCGSGSNWIYCLGIP
jgi:hypothetical protein